MQSSAVVAHTVWLVGEGVRTVVQYGSSAFRVGARDAMWRMDHASGVIIQHTLSYGVIVRDTVHRTTGP